MNKVSVTLDSDQWRTLQLLLVSRIHDLSIWQSSPAKKRQSLMDGLQAIQQEIGNAVRQAETPQHE